MKRYSLLVGIISVFTAEVCAQSGSLDNTFSLDGKLTTQIGAAGSIAEALLIQPDTKIVVAGNASNGTDADFALVRYNADGTLDNTFNTTGKVLTDFSNGQDLCKDIVLQSDGKIIAGGRSNTGLALVRYNPDGSLDPTFGLNGKVTIGIGTQDYCRAIALQADGKIVVGGTSYSPSTGNRFLIARYQTDGSIDNTFGGSGFILLQISPGPNQAYAIAIQPNDQKIILAGSAFNTTTLLWDAALVRYNPDGTPDLSFGTNSEVITPVGQLSAPVTSDNFVYALTLLPDGKMVAAGYVGTGGQDKRFMVLKYLPDGSLDPSFGGDGIVFSQVGSQNDVATAVVAQGTKLLVGGSSLVSSTSNRFVIACYDAFGNLDNTFGGTGVVTTAVASNDGIEGLALQPDGKIVAAGVAFNGTAFDFAVARYFSGVVGIPALDEQAYMLSVYPNPTGDNATFEYRLKAENSVTVSLLDQQGRVVHMVLDNQQQTPGMYQQKIDFENLPTGMYFLKMTTSEGEATLRISKQ